MKQLIVALLSAMLTSVALGADQKCLETCAESDSTSSLRLCLGAELTEARRLLALYLEAAREEWAYRPATEGTAEEREMLDAYNRAIPDELNRAQMAWDAYVEAHCSAVGAVWTNGSGRAAAELDCRLRQVRDRTTEVWRVYLSEVSSLAAPAKPCTE